ncbi:unnamed protein product, partial [marine sediment metagenome]
MVVVGMDLRSADVFELTPVVPSHAAVGHGDV